MNVTIQETVQEAGASAVAEAATESSSRQCPTRVAGEAPLFQHRVSARQCESKQRGQYHKCFTCVHSGRVG